MITIARTQGPDIGDDLPDTPNESYGDWLASLTDRQLLRAKYIAEQTGMTLSALWWGYARPRPQSFDTSSIQIREQSR